MLPIDLWKTEGYSCTDPDNLQYLKKNDDGTFSFKEYNRFEFPEEFSMIVDGRIHESFDKKSMFWIEGIVNLDDYTKTEIFTSTIAYGYYPSGDKWIDQSGNEIPPEIIAECIFEQESGLY